MARRGLLKTGQPRNPEVAALQAAVRDAVDQLALDHDVVSAPVVTLVATANIPPGASIVAYVGGPNATLTLPPANALGANVGAVVFLLNTASVAVTVVPSRGDSVNGTTSLSVAAGVLCVLASDGSNKWLRNV